MYGETQIRRNDDDEHASAWEGDFDRSVNKESGRVFLGLWTHRWLHYFWITCKTQGWGGNAKGVEMKQYFWCQLLLGWSEVKAEWWVKKREEFWKRTRWRKDFPERLFNRRLTHGTECTVVCVVKKSLRDVWSVSWKSRNQTYMKHSTKLISVSTQMKNRTKHQHTIAIMQHRSHRISNTTLISL